MFKFNEDKLLQEYEEYVRATYSQHYSDEDGLPDKGQYRKDLFKVIHYAFLLINWLDEKDAKMNEHKRVSLSELKDFDC